MSDTFQHRYRQPTPYEVLGVSPTASAVEVRDKFAEQEREIRESGLNSSERAQRGEKLKLAYDLVSAGSQRVRVDFYLLDSRLGQMQAQSLADTIPKPNLSLGDVIKPRKIHVTHEVLWDDLERLEAEPPRIEGLHPRPIPTDVERELPPLLAIQFDC